MNAIWTQIIQRIELAIFPMGRGQNPLLKPSRIPPPKSSPIGPCEHIALGAMKEGRDLLERKPNVHPKYSRLSHETLASCPYYDYCHDTYVMPDGNVGNYYYLDLLGSTMAVPVLPDGRFVLVRQHRYLVNRASLEFPAGGLKRGLDPLENARAELREEAGYVAARWTKIGAFAPCNGLSNEMCHVYIAEDLSVVGAAPEPSEEIEVVELTAAEIEEKIRTGALWDGMTLAALRQYEACSRGGAR